MTDTFLILSLFIPRITLLIYWIDGSIPHNNVPMVGDFLLALLLPRVLILLYIVDNLGVSSEWFYIHLIVALFVWVFSYLKTIINQKQ